MYLRALAGAHEQLLQHAAERQVLHHVEQVRPAGRHLIRRQMLQPDVARGDAEAAQRGEERCSAVDRSFRSAAGSAPQQPGTRPAPDRRSPAAPCTAGRDPGRRNTAGSSRSRAAPRRPAPAPQEAGDRGSCRIHARIIAAGAAGPRALRFPCAAAARRRSCPGCPCAASAPRRPAARR